MKKTARKIFVEDISLTNKIIDNISISSTKKNHKVKPKKSFKEEVENNHLNNLDEFSNLIEHGKSIKNCFDLESIKGNLHIINDPVLYIDKKNENEANIKSGKITMNILQRKKAIEFCSFQCIFFDIDNCENPDYKSVIEKLNIAPNIIYETFSYTKEKPRYRLVYIIDEVLKSEYYTDVYDEFLKKIGLANFEFDNCCNQPTQTIFTTNRKSYIINKNYYHIKYNEIKTKDEEHETNILNISILDRIKKHNKILVEKSFLDYGVSHKVSDIVEHYSVYNKSNNDFKCILITNQCPNNFNDKFLISDENTLDIPEYYFGNGKPQKYFINNGRKRFISNLCKILLLMNNNITIEDLIYNVFVWCNEHVNFSVKTNHALTNPDIILICKGEFYKFYNYHIATQVKDYEEAISMIKSKYHHGKRKCINQYYCGTIENKHTFFYMNYKDKFPDNVEEIKYKDLCSEFDNINIKRRTRDDKGESRNKSYNDLKEGSKTKMIIYYLNNNVRPKVILKELNIKKAYLYNVKRRYKNLLLKSC